MYLVSIDYGDYEAPNPLCVCPTEEVAQEFIAQLYELYGKTKSGPWLHAEEIASIDTASDASRFVTYRIDLRDGKISGDDKYITSPQEDFVHAYEGSGRYISSFSNISRAVALANAKAKYKELK